MPQRHLDFSTSFLHLPFLHGSFGWNEMMKNWFEIRWILFSEGGFWGYSIGFEVRTVSQFFSSVLEFWILNSIGFLRHSDVFSVTQHGTLGENFLLITWKCHSMKFHGHSIFNVTIKNLFRLIIFSLWMPIQPSSASKISFSQFLSSIFSDPISMLIKFRLRLHSNLNNFLTPRLQFLFHILHSSAGSW